MDAFGIRGAFKVLPHAADPQALYSSRRWHLRAPDAVAGRPLPALLRITSARAHGDVVVAQARDVDDRNAAEALRGAAVYVGRSSFPTAGADEFYWVDLIGLQVVNRDGVDLGRVESLLDTGVHSVLRVGQGEAERLIPFVAAYIDAVELAEQRIRVDWGTDF